MKYQLELSSIPQSFEELDSKYQSIKKIIESSELWKEGKELLPKLKTQPSKPKWHVNLTRSLISGYKGYISFNNRYSIVNSEGMYDDRLILEFNPIKIDFDYLRGYFFNSVSTEFSSYRASIVNISLVLKDIDKKGVIDTRKKFDRFHFIDFIRNDFCEIYFKISAKKITDLLLRNNFDVREVKDGIIIILAEDILSDDELERRSDDAIKIIQNKFDKRRFFFLKN